jgi:hypothetical protein
MARHESKQKRNKTPRIVVIKHQRINMETGEVIGPARKKGK